ncbi:UNVERIFIED_CONTAM: hypothetical protein GTU68_029260 [Idotea baltica]|nr:hypothetical protein [Idotea baltica]
MCMNTTMSLCRSPTAISQSRPPTGRRWLHRSALACRISGARAWPITWQTMAMQRLRSSKSSCSTDNACCREQTSSCALASGSGQSRYGGSFRAGGSPSRCRCCGACVGPSACR